MKVPPGFRFRMVMAIHVRSCKTMFRRGVLTQQTVADGMKGCPMSRLQSRLIRRAGSLVLCVSLLQAANATDILVPFNIPTIQGAINAASSGDNIVLLPQIFTERINLGGKNVVIKPLNNDFQPV